MVICRIFVNMKTGCKKTNSLLGGQLQYLSVRQGRQPPSTKTAVPFLEPRKVAYTLTARVFGKWTIIRDIH